MQLYHVVDMSTDEFEEIIDEEMHKLGLKKAGKGIMNFFEVIF